jgi:hypothetical protein
MKVQLSFLFYGEQFKWCRAVTPHSLLSWAIMDDEIKLLRWHFGTYQGAFSKLAANLK